MSRASFRAANRASRSIGDCARSSRHPELADEFKDVFAEGGRWYDNPPAGIDSINWRAFFSILYKYGYDGYLAIEPHSATWQGEKGEKGVKYTIKYIRDLML